MNGQVKAIRFTRRRRSTGTHIGNLWSLSGDQARIGDLRQRDDLRMAAGQPVRSGDAHGWHGVRRLLLRTRRALRRGHRLLRSFGVDSPPLHALADGVSGGDGVYKYGTSSVFPTTTFQSEGYYVDVVFSTVPVSAPAAPANVTATAGNATATVNWTAPADGGSAVTSYTVTPYIGTTAQTPTDGDGQPAGDDARPSPG